jgi:hypothetical protein
MKVKRLFSNQFRTRGLFGASLATWACCLAAASSSLTAAPDGTDGAGTGGAAVVTDSSTCRTRGDSAGTGGKPVGGNIDVWYEAEAPENVLDNGAVAERCTDWNTCTAVTEGAKCCSGGGQVRWLLGRGGTNNAGGGVTFTGVKVPSAGVYDVTWWYHCGDYDNWHDNNCGGPPYPSWMSWYNPQANPQPGCRVHLIEVNGTQVNGPDNAPFWHFPCYGGPWSMIHASTTSLTLAAGTNKIRLQAPHIADLDAVDLDAIHVVPAGKGTPPQVFPRAIAGDNNRK